MGVFSVQAHTCKGGRPPCGPGLGVGQSPAQEAQMATVPGLCPKVVSWICYSRARVQNLPGEGMCPLGGCAVGKTALSLTQL